MIDDYDGLIGPGQDAFQAVGNMLRGGSVTQLTGLAGQLKASLFIDQFFDGGSFARIFLLESTFI